MMLLYCLYFIIFVTNNLYKKLIIYLRFLSNKKCFIAFVQDDNDVQYLLDNIPMSMHKVSCISFLI